MALPTEQSNAIAQIFVAVLDWSEKDISRARQRVASSTTAEYVDNYMNNVMSVDTNLKVHDLAISQIPPSLSSGLILEFGVFQGRSINHIAKKLSFSKIDGFDSFEGLPEAWRDGYAEGSFKMNQLPTVESNVTLHKGWFDSTLPAFLEKVESGINVGYLHVDCDLYSSTKTIFACLANRIKSGTVIVFDEYFNYPGWQGGEFKAFKEFIAYSGLSYEYLTYNRLHEQVAVQIQ